MSNHNILSNLITTHKALNDTLYRMIEQSNVNNDLIHQTILSIPSLSKIFKRILFLSKSLIRLDNNHNGFVIDIINEYIRPNVIILNSLIHFINNFIESAPSFYFNKHELCYSLDFYKAIHSSFYEQLYVFTNKILSC